MLSSELAPPSADEADPAPADRRNRFPTPRRRRAWRWLGVAALGGSLAAALLGATARLTDAGELAVNLSVYCGAGALVGGLAFFAARAWRAGLLGCVAAGWLLAPIGVLYLPPSTTARAATPSAGGELVVAAVNVCFENHSPDEFVAWVEEERPDVLGVLEATSLWHHVLDGLDRLYPHRVEEPLPQDLTGHEGGMVFLSRLPLENARLIPTPHGGRPYIEARVDVGGVAVDLTLLHPPRPGLGWGTDQRNALLAEVAARPFGPRSVVFGDLNATVHSPAFGDFLDRTGLADSRKGFGWQPSWRSVKHVPGVWLDLDHVLIGNAVRVLDRRVGPDIGSDHRPVVARLAIERPDPAEPEGAEATDGVAERPNRSSELISFRSR